MSILTGGEVAMPPGTEPDAAVDAALDITACDREPIHVPGAIQPHGLLLIADRADLRVIGGAGDLDRRLTPAWLGRPLGHLLAQDVAAVLAEVGTTAAVALARVPGRTETFDATLHASADRLLVELEPAPEAHATAASILARLDLATTQFERAGDLTALCERAAVVFREMTGFDRVMIYRFLDGGAGMVIAENTDPGVRPFLNHHFPATDIPRQARALYVRNRVRVIPDVEYVPAPIVPAELAGIDLSDVQLRSVSPIHLQYMRNMGMRASASISIVQDGVLWGLVACHNLTPRALPYETRVACATLVGGLARQIRAKEEAVAYRERIRLRAAEDVIAGQIDRDQSFEHLIDGLGQELCQMLSADGFATVRGRAVSATGLVPPVAELRALARWLAPRAAPETFATRSIGELHPPAQGYASLASGVLATTLSIEQPTLLIWFRAEENEVVSWAGDPHKGSDADPTLALSPRKSFDEWVETVRGRSRAWTLPQIEAAGRLRRKLFEARQAHRLRELNRELSATVADKEALLVQKDHLLREVNHRVQNSLQLVQAFLGLQARDADPALAGHLGEAQRRLSAVALVHRRLYQGDQVDTVDLARYLEELIDEMRGVLGPDWSANLSLDLAPMLITADRAVNVGLILTELVINANKYAYDGAAGPVAIALEQYRDQFRLVVADRGRGKQGPREGFGTRMMRAMIQRLDGEIDQSDNHPGLRVIVTAPIAADSGG